MKQLLFFISALAFMACSSFKVANHYEEKIKAGETVIEPNACGVFSSGIFGDFPLKITKEDGSALSDSAEVDEEYSATHYIVQADGSVSQEEEEPKCSAGEEDSEKDEGSKKNTETTKTEEKPKKDPATVAAEAVMDKCKKSGGTPLTYSVGSGYYGCECPKGKTKSPTDMDMCVFLPATTARGSSSGALDMGGGGTAPATQ